MSKRPTVKQAKQCQPLNHTPNWFDLLAMLVILRYLQCTQPQQSANAQISRLLIIAVALVLTVVALVAAGTPQYVVEVLKYWPLHL